MSRYPLVRDLPDNRDFLYTIEPRELHAPLPHRVDLRRHCPRVQDQGEPGTCTAHAVAAAYAFEQRVQHFRPITPSRLFIYYNERSMTGQRGLNCVVRLRDALKAVYKRGVCPEVLWPYKEDSKTLRAKPPKETFEVAAARRIVEYHRIPIGTMSRGKFLQHLKRCMADGCPFVFGFALYKSFESPEVKKSGIMPVPDHKREKPIGGHAVMAVGYNDQRKAVLVRNSWGLTWGIKGYFWMPYRLITDPDFAHDFWTVRGVTG
jgi:C1A family cysteine protease